MSDCFVLYLLLICMKKKKSGAGKFTNNNLMKCYPTMFISTMLTQTLWK